MSNLYDLQKHHVMIADIWPLPNGQPPTTMIEFMEDFGELPRALVEALAWSGDPLDIMDRTELLFDGPGGGAFEAWQSLMGDLELRGKAGFLVHFRRPWIKYGPDKIQSVHWNVQTSYCGFSETIDGAVATAVALANDVDALGFSEAKRAQA